ncbi:hypothetical protein AHAS_Ahas11G0074600 [Arachis hypogaea]
MSCSLHLSSDGGPRPTTFTFYGVRSPLRYKTLLTILVYTRCELIRDWTRDFQ